MNYRVNIFGQTFLFFLLIFSPSTHSLEAAVSGPGWSMVEDVPVSIDESYTFYADQENQLSKVSAVPAVNLGVTPDAIKELALALQKDPKLIFDYVHNHIDYVPYFGALKGAALTLIDGNGNDFDQAALMVALLRESGFVANFVYATVIYDDWLDLVNQVGTKTGFLNNTLTLGGLVSILKRGGIPNDNSGGHVSRVSRVWVRATINDIAFDFDPAFKSFEYINKKIEDMGAAIGYDRANFIAAAKTPGGAPVTASPDFVENLNENRISEQLVEYSATLVNTIKTDYANASLEEIIGGRKIIKTKLAEYPVALPYSIDNTKKVFVWAEIPGSYQAKIEIQCSEAGLYYPPIYTSGLGGKRITITHDVANGQPELRYDGALLESGIPMVVGTKYRCDVIMDHPYAANNGDLADTTGHYSIKSGSTSSLFYGFSTTSGKRLSSYYDGLNRSVTAGMSNTSEEVLGRRLSILGLNLVAQWQATEKILSSLSDLVSFSHHMIGIAQYNGSTMVDIPQVRSTISTNGAVDYFAILETSALKAATIMGSAFEHNVLEQTSGQAISALSTTSLLRLANTSGGIYRVDSTNIYEKLLSTDYPDAQQNLIHSRLTQPGSYAILPGSWKLGGGELKYSGYILNEMIPHAGSHVSMNIGEANGGYCDLFECSYFEPYEGFCRNPNNWCENPESEDPVDMFTGGFLLDALDVTVGNARPVPIQVSRAYNSRNNNANFGLGYGWTHNNEGRIGRRTQPWLSLGTRKAEEVAAMLVERYVTTDLMKHEDTLLGWVLGAISSEWATRQLINNAVSARLGDKELTYVTLPDGSFSSPPGDTSKLMENPDGTFSILGRFGSSMHFDADGHIKEMKDADGSKVRYYYNDTGRLDSMMSSLVGNNGTDQLPINRLKFRWTGGNITSIDLNPSAYNTPTPSDRTVSYKYDSAGDLVEYTDRKGKITKYGYDANHRMETITNPREVTTVTNIYGPLDRVISQTMPRQGGTNVSYNFYYSGFRNIEEDSAGSQTIYYFDEKGRSVGIENNLGHRSTIEYDGQNHVTRVTDRLGHSTSYFYDGDNNLTEMINALNEKTVYTPDAEFRLKHITDHLGHITSFDYDYEHHLILREDAEGNAIKTGYTNRGMRETVEDARNTVTKFTYHPNGRLEDQKTGKHPNIFLDFNNLGGELTSLTDGEGATTELFYDKDGLITDVIDPLEFTTKYTYDDAGNLDSRTDRNGDLTVYSYTPTNKLERVTSPSGGELYFYYNEQDKIHTMDHVASPGNFYHGAQVNSYDGAGRLNFQYGPYAFTTSYLYDEAGNVEEVTYPGEKTVWYTYDELNRLKTVTNWLGQTVTYYYDSGGRLTNVDNFNGTKTNLGYDKANRLTALDSVRQDATVLASYQFTLDGNGNRIRVIQNEPLVPQLSGNSVFNYNPEKNRLLSADGSSFSYDNEGQLSSKDGTTFTFDSAHRLTDIGPANQNPTPVHFLYDGNGNRIKAVRDGIETRYIYDLWGNLIAEADANNNITRYYVYGKGLLAMIMPTGKVYTYHYNANGNTVAVTDEEQQIVNSYSYSPFGTIDQEQEAVPQPFKYVGQYGVMAEPGGLYYMRARYYDPDAKRFISQDPIGFGGGDVNLYAYVSNNPIRFVDPSGLVVLTASSAGGVGKAGYYVAFSYDTDNGRVALTYGTGVGAGFGASATVNTGNIPANRTGGQSTTINASAGVYGVGVQSSIGVDKNGETRSLGGGFGVGAGLSTTVNDTICFRHCSEDKEYDW